MSSLRSRLSFRRFSSSDWAIGSSLAAVLFVILFAAALRRDRHMLTGFDLAYFTQATWNINHGHNPFSTMRGLYVLGDHANFILFPIAPLTAIFPAHAALLGLQAAAFAVGALFVFLLARNVVKISRPLAIGVTVSYMLFPAMQNTNMADFHPEVLALPALIGSVYFALQRKWIRYGVCISIALACREDIAIAVFLLGAMLAIKDFRRAGLITMAVSVVTLAVNIGYVLPHFAGKYEQAEKFGRYGESLVDIVMSAVTHPQWVIHDLTTGPNPGTLVALFGPVLFLCLLAPRWLLPGIPLQLLYMLSTNVAAQTIDHHYTVVINAFIYIATVFALKDRNWPQIKVAFLLVFSGICFCVTDSLIFKAANGTDLLYNADPRTQSIAKAVDSIGSNNAVLATARFYPRLDEREDLYNFSRMYEDGYHPVKDPKSLADRQAQFEFLALDTYDLWQWEPGWRKDLLDPELATGNWKQIFNENGIELYQRQRS